MVFGKKKEKTVSAPKEIKAPVTSAFVPSTKVEPDIQGSAEGMIVFMAGELEVLKFCPNGKAYVRGELMDKNQELYNEVKRWFESTRN
jgi:hypothetical protein